MDNDEMSERSTKARNLRVLRALNFEKADISVILHRLISSNVSAVVFSRAERLLNWLQLMAVRLFSELSWDRAEKLDILHALRFRVCREVSPDRDAISLTLV